MAVYTDISDSDLRQLLEDYALGDLREFEGIAAGVVNSNFFVTTDSGRYVLTVFETLNANELPYFLNLTGHLAAAGIPCPGPVLGTDGQALRELHGKPAALVQCLAGTSVPDVSSLHCALAGRALARMHLCAADFRHRRVNPQGLAWATQALDTLRSSLNADELELLEDELGFLRHARPQDLPQGVIHGDLFHDNVLFSGESISGIIDFYYACDDALLLDLAITVNDWCSDSDGHLDPGLAQAMLNAYDETRPLSDEEHASWSAMLRAAALRFWVSRLLDKHFPRAGSITTIKDPDEYRRILELRRR